MVLEIERVLKVNPFELGEYIARELNISLLPICVLSFLGLRDYLGLYGWAVNAIKCLL